MNIKIKTKKFIKRWPIIYFLAKKLYFTFNYRGLKVRILGTVAQENEWASRHLHKCERERDDWGSEGDDWIRGYWSSKHHPHRQFLVEKISEYKPSSILEIGCNCGPNLYLLGKRYPGAEIKGIDINPIAVCRGNEWLANEGISNVKLFEGKADELSQFKNESFDLVFTDAILIYIGPDKIQTVIKELLRIARNGLVLLERNCFEPGKDPYGLGIMNDGLWERNYVSLLKQFVSIDQIRISRMAQDIWPDPGWQRSGAIIEVLLKFQTT